MNFEWFAKENIFTKASIILACFNILFILLIVLLLLLHVTPTNTLPAGPLETVLIFFDGFIGFSPLLALIGVACGAIGLVKDLKEKKPHKIAIIAIVANLFAVAFWILVPMLLFPLPQ
jgi:hypothetical protein